MKKTFTDSNLQFQKDHQLIDAIKQDDLALVNKRLLAGANPNSGNDPDRNSPLHHAANRASAPVILALHSHGANLEAKDIHGRTPVFWSINEGGSEENLRQFINLRVNLKLVSNYKKTLLHIAIEAKNEECINMLFRAGLDLDCYKPSLLKRFVGSIFKAEGNNEEGNEDKDAYGFYASHLVDNPVIGPLIQSHILHRRAYDALSVFSKRNFLGIKSEIDLGRLRLDFTDAVKALDFEKVKSMMDKGMDPNFTQHHGGPLHCAAYMKGAQGLAMVDLLLDAGAEAGVRDGVGRTPIHYAASGDRLETVIRLVSKGADLHAENFGKSTPLHFAMISKGFRCLEFFLDRGADPDAKNREGDSLKVNVSFPKMTEFFNAWERRSFARRALEEINESIEVAKIGPGRANHFNVQPRPQP